AALGKAADQGDFAAEANGAERAGEGLRPADLDDVIDATAAGEFDRRLVPFRRALVVDAAGGAERLGARELLVARRGDDCGHAYRVRELQAEDRYAPGALQQHALASVQPGVMHHR